MALGAAEDQKSHTPKRYGRRIARPAPGVVRSASISSYSVCRAPSTLAVSVRAAVKYRLYTPPQSDTRVRVHTPLDNFFSTAVLTSLVSSLALFRGSRNNFAADDAITRMAAAQDKAHPRTVLLWQRSWPSTLPFMYMSIVNTLRKGFAAATNAPHVIVGSGTHGRNQASWEGNVSVLRKGDLVIWIGAGFNLVDWRSLRRSGLRCVLYQTEIQHSGCVLRRDMIDELVRALTFRTKISRPVPY